MLTPDFAELLVPDQTMHTIQMMSPSFNALWAYSNKFLQNPLLSTIQGKSGRIKGPLPNMTIPFFLEQLFLRNIPFGPEAHDLCLSIVLLLLLAGRVCMCTFLHIWKSVMHKAQTLVYHLALLLDQEFQDIFKWQVLWSEKFENSVLM